MRWPLIHISAAALQDVLQDQEFSSDIVVSYFYFDFNDAEKQSSKKAIRSLMLQCAQQARDGAQALEQLYHKCRDGQQQPAEDTVQSLLQDTLAGPGQKFVVLDALDECTDPEGMLTFLHTVAQAQYSGLRILATGRRDRDIDAHLSLVAEYNIDIQSAVVDQDIRVYVQARLTTDPKLRKWPAAVQEEISQVMMEKAGGMYVNNIGGQPWQY